MSTIKIKKDLSEIIESIRSLIEATYRPANVGRCGQKLSCLSSSSPSNCFDRSLFESQTTDKADQISHLAQCTYLQPILH